MTSPDPDNEGLTPLWWAIASLAAMTAIFAAATLL